MGPTKVVPYATFPPFLRKVDFEEHWNFSEETRLTIRLPRRILFEPRFIGASLILRPAEAEVSER